MTRRILTRPIAFALLLTLAACAHGLALKQTALTSLQASEQALHDARVAELALYTAKTVPGYDAPKHIAFLDALDKAQIAVQDSSRAAQAWKPGQPAPTSAKEYVTFAQSMLDIAKALNVPAAATLLAKTQTVLDQATAALKALNGGK